MNQHRAPGSTLNARNVIAALVVVLILFFLVRFLYHHWREVATFDFSFNYYYLALSFVALFIFFFLRVLLLEGDAQQDEHSTQHEKECKGVIFEHDGEIPAGKGVDGFR